jgi:hypothetical protein
MERHESLDGQERVASCGTRPGQCCGQNSELASPSGRSTEREDQVSTMWHTLVVISWWYYCSTCTLSSARHLSWSTYLLGYRILHKLSKIYHTIHGPWNNWNKIKLTFFSPFFFLFHVLIFCLTFLFYLLLYGIYAFIFLWNILNAFHWTYPSIYIDIVLFLYSILWNVLTSFLDIFWYLYNSERFQVRAGINTIVHHKKVLFFSATAAVHQGYSFHLS